MSSSSQPGGQGSQQAPGGGGVPEEQDSSLSLDQQRQQQQQRPWYPWQQQHQYPQQQQHQYPQQQRPPIPWQQQHQYPQQQRPWYPPQQQHQYLQQQHQYLQQQQAQYLQQQQAQYLQQQEPQHLQQQQAQYLQQQQAQYLQQQEPQYLQQQQAQYLQQQQAQYLQQQEPQHLQQESDEEAQQFRVEQARTEWEQLSMQQHVPPEWVQGGQQASVFPQVRGQQQHHQHQDYRGLFQQEEQYSPSEMHPSEVEMVRRVRELAQAQQQKETLGLPKQTTGPPQQMSERQQVMPGSSQQHTLRSQQQNQPSSAGSQTGASQQRPQVLIPPSGDPSSRSSSNAATPPAVPGTVPGDVPGDVPVGMASDVSGTVPRDVAGDAARRQKEPEERFNAALGKLLDPDQRMSGLDELQAVMPEMAAELWHAPGAVSVFILELVNAYPVVLQGFLEDVRAIKAVKIMTIFSELVGCGEVCQHFIDSKLLHYVLPLVQINFAESDAARFEELQLSSLGVLEAVFQVRPAYANRFILEENCFTDLTRLMTKGTLRVRTVAAYIVMKITGTREGIDAIIRQNFLQDLQAALRSVLKLVLSSDVRSSRDAFVYVAGCYLYLAESGRGAVSLPDVPSELLGDACLPWCQADRRSSSVVWRLKRMFES